MTTIPDKSVISPVLIGRAAYVESLDRAMDEARSYGKTVLVAGEAGVGKTRLVDVSKIRAAARGLLTLTGNAFEPDRTLPYAPLIDLLRRFLSARSPDEILEHLGSGARDLVKKNVPSAHLSPRVDAPQPQPIPF